MSQLLSESIARQRGGAAQDGTGSFGSQALSARNCPAAMGPFAGGDGDGPAGLRGRKSLSASLRGRRIILVDPSGFVSPFFITISIPLSLPLFSPWSFVGFPLVEQDINSLSIFLPQPKTAILFSARIGCSQGRELNCCPENATGGP